MIKTFIIAAITADGFIAKDSNHAAYWTSKEDKARFVEITKRAGAVIMGSTTYQTLKRPLADRLNIVYSKNKTFEGAETTQAEPRDILKDLESRGYSEIAICGGSQIYSMFLQAHCVDKIFLTIEPKIFGTGITLFNTELTFDLTLISSETTPTGTILAEYDVNYHGGKLSE